MQIRGKEKSLLFKMYKKYFRAKVTSSILDTEGMLCVQSIKTFANNGI